MSSKKYFFLNSFLLCSACALSPGSEDLSPQISNSISSSSPSSIINPTSFSSSSPVTQGSPSVVASASPSGSPSVVASASPSGSPSVVASASPSVTSSPRVGIRMGINTKNPLEVSYHYKFRLSSDSFDLDSAQIRTVELDCKYLIKPQTDKNFQIDLWQSNIEDSNSDLFNIAQASATPSPSPSGNSIHYKFVVNPGGQILSVMEPTYFENLPISYANQLLAPYTRTLFSMYNRKVVYKGQSWVAQDYLLGNIYQNIQNASLSSKRDPRWELSEVGDVLDLEYNSRTRMRRQDDTTYPPEFKDLLLTELGNATVDPSTGLVKELNSELRFELEDGPAIESFTISMKRL